MNRFILCIALLLGCCLAHDQIDVVDSYAKYETVEAVQHVKMREAFRKNKIPRSSKLKDYQSAYWQGLKVPTDANAVRNKPLVNRKLLCVYLI